MKSLGTRNHVRGFTLIELLVVILIIAILAAIAIPVFIAQRNKAYRAQVESALKNAATALESYSTETGGDFSAADGADSDPVPLGNGPYQAVLTANGFKKATDVHVHVIATGLGYCVSAIHPSLPVSDIWHEAVYQSATGNPVPDADGAC